MKFRLLIVVGLLLSICVLSPTAPTTPSIFGPKTHLDTLKEEVDTLRKDKDEIENKKSDLVIAVRKAYYERELAIERESKTIANSLTRKTVNTLAGITMNSKREFDPLRILLANAGFAGLIFVAYQFEVWRLLKHDPHAFANTTQRRALLNLLLTFNTTDVPVLKATICAYVMYLLAASAGIFGDIISPHTDAQAAQLYLEQTGLQIPDSLKKAYKLAS